MTAISDPRDPTYVDEASVRDELTRVFDVCQGCRRCSDLCGSFTTLFELLDGLDRPEAGELTPAQQDQVVEGCVQCKLCHVGCPFVPERLPHRIDRAIDVPRLMLRAEAMRHANHQQPIRERIATHVLARTDLLGRLATAAAPLARLATKLTGAAPYGGVAPYAERRFSAWFRTRGEQPTVEHDASVTVFATCIVEYRYPRIGRDLVRVFERDGIGCSVSDAGCCGAPWLHAGHVDRFTEVAHRNVEQLAGEIRAGAGDIVVPDPACGHVLVEDYVDHVDDAHRADAELVARHVRDVAEYLVGLRRGEGTAPDTNVLDTSFHGEAPERIVLHTDGLRADALGVARRELLERAGAQVEIVHRVDEIADARAADASDGVVTVACDSHLANAAIAKATGSNPTHTVSLLARE